MNMLKTSVTRRLPLRNRLTLTAATLVLAAAALAFYSGFSQAGSRQSGRNPLDGLIAAALEPDTIKLGEGAVLVVQVAGDHAAPPALTPVNGLQFYNMGRRSQYQSINGRVSATTTYLFQVQPEHSGKFTIPPVAARINGRLYKTNSVTLTVIKGTARHLQPQSPSRSRAPQSQRQSAAPRTGTLMSWEKNQPAFLRVLPRAGSAYVGELLPVEIKAYFHQGVQASLNSFPMIEGQAFSFREMKDKPGQTREILDGVGYNVLTWYTGVSAVKEGEHEVSVALNATLGIPQQSRRRSPFGRGFFDDDFFDHFFSDIREEPVKLTNPRLKLRILPLPRMGRPADFSGAVGDFKLTATATPQKTMVGDPITVKMILDGTGNFDRVACPRLQVGENFKTYRPSSTFTPESTTEYRGEKCFEQAVIPLSADVKSIPPVTFSYFDTGEKKYVTLRTKAIPIDLTAGTQQARTDQPNPPTTASTPQEPSTSPVPAKGEKNTLHPIHVAMGPTVKSLKPLVSNPLFLGAQALPLGALFMGLFLTRRQRKYAVDPGLERQKRVRQEVSRQVKNMDLAITAHDVPAFFKAARAACQERLGEIWGQAPESITLSEIRYRLGDDGKGIITVFQNADAAAYSGQTFTPESLRKFRGLLVSELKQIH